MLIPPACPLCGRPGEAPCRPCRAGLRRAPAMPPPPGVDRCAALLDYDGPGRELVARLKYRNARSTVPWLALSMGALVPAGSVDVVTWAPTAAGRRRRRGFDQAELLARALAAGVGRPCRPLLRRRPGPPQTGRALGDRWAGPAFRPAVSLRPGTRVLLVDDVVTTGATLAAAAAALRRAGAHRVDAVAAARTRPDRRSARPPTIGDGRVRVCG